MSGLNYGPLAGLIGSWEGDRGQDRSPEPDGVEENAFRETIVFSSAGEVDNAETQALVSVHYQLAVNRLPDGKLIHHQTGYWIWDEAAATVMHCFTIPRAVAVIAGGYYAGETSDGKVIIEVSAGLDHPDWQIIQSPFMQQHARSTGFQQRIEIGAGQLHYRQTTLVDIYGRESFQHNDENSLQRVSG